MEEKRFSGKATISATQHEAASAPLTEEQRLRYKEFMSELSIDLDIEQDTKAILYKKNGSMLIAFGKPGSFKVYKPNIDILLSNRKAKMRGEAHNSGLLHGFIEAKANRVEMAYFEEYYFRAKSPYCIPIGNLPMDMFGHATIAIRLWLKKVLYPDQDNQE